MGTTAFSTLIQDCAKALAEGKYPVVSTSTATGTTATIVDASLNDTGSEASTSRFQNCWIRTSFGTPSVEYVRQAMLLAPNTPAGSATITLAGPALGANHATSTSYEIHYGLHPSDLKECICEALRNMVCQAYYPLGLLENPDMEDATISTAWTEEASDAPAVTAETTAANVYRGKQSLKAVATGANEYGYQAINVVAGKVMCVFATGRMAAAATSAQLIAYDVTNSAAIDTWDFDEIDWQEVGGTLATPSGSKSLSVRLNVVTAGATAYFDDVQCYYADQKEFVLPSWITDRSQIGDVYYLPEGSPGPDEGRMVNETRLVYLDTPKILEGPGRFRIQISGASIGRPLYLAASRYYAELSADTDTTTADKDTVVEGALFFVYKRKGSDFEKDARTHLSTWLARRRVREPAMDGHFANAY